MKTHSVIRGGSRLVDAGKALAVAGAALAVISSSTLEAPAMSQGRKSSAPGVTTAVISLAAQRQALVPRSAADLRVDDRVRVSTVPPTGGSAFETQPVVSAFEFEDAIINTYHVIEPWVRYGFEVATYAVGWLPWVGWLSPQIMIVYNFGERIVESLVVNSANWLWGPLPFFEGVANVARDSWNALVQLGIDEWNFWLPPLPPLPLARAQDMAPALKGIANSSDIPTFRPAERPHPIRDALRTIARFLPELDVDARHETERPRLFDRDVHRAPIADIETATSAPGPGIGLPRSYSRGERAIPAESQRSSADSELIDAVDRPRRLGDDVNTSKEAQQSGRRSPDDSPDSATSPVASRTRESRIAQDHQRPSLSERHTRRQPHSAAATSAES